MYVDFIRESVSDLLLMRKDNRTPTDLRELIIKPIGSSYAEGCVEASYGLTKVLCTASVEESRPKWLSKSAQGWLTAEYNMLPRSTFHRTKRERVQSSGRTQEISRLIGRSLRACIDLKALGERQIYIDCDVLQADGGTRVTSITGGFVALALALKKLKDTFVIKNNPLLFYVSALSIGIINNEIIVDPSCEEDQKCSTDLNIVLSSQNNSLVEIQATAERALFTQDQLQQMIQLASTASQSIFKKQEEVIGDFFPLKI